MKFYLGIDPGKSGSYSIVDNQYHIRVSKNFPIIKMIKPELDISQIVKTFIALSIQYEPLIAVLEKVHAMPKQGVTSMFSFGETYGIIKTALVAANIPYQEVTPQAWTKKMLVGMPGIGKERAYKRACQMFPYWDPITAKDKDKADSILIACYGFENTKEK
jgi:crossover junction endodeoxyribonuclease RuvC